MKSSKQRQRVSGVNLTWVELNALLMKLTDEQDVLALLEEERALATPRSGRMFRLHARYNKLRGVREKGDLF